MNWRMLSLTSAIVLKSKSLVGNYKRGYIGVSLCWKEEEVTIVRHTNRKKAWQGLISGRNLKGASRIPVHINNSFCPEFAKYGYYIQRLKLQLAGYHVRHGVYQVQLQKDGDSMEISHSSDFAKHGLDIESFQK